MNLVFRLLLVMTAARFRGAVPVLGPCRTPFRVLPTDLDLLRHVNNGVYLSLMDVGRVDLIVRAGLLPKLFARGWYPIVAAETIRFRRPLTLFQRFEIVTRVLGWDDKAMLLEQRFERGGELVAHALVSARFLARSGGSVSVADIVALADNPPRPQNVPEYALRWSAGLATWRADAPV